MTLQTKRQGRGVVETRVRELIDEGHDYNRIADFRRVYQAKYNVGVDSTTVRRYGQLYMRDLKGVMPKSKVKPPVDEDPDDFTLGMDTQTIGNMSVPEKIRYVETIVKKVGDYDKVMEIADMVAKAGNTTYLITILHALQLVGGLPNFANIISIIRTLSVTPTRPQTAPLLEARNGGTKENPD